MALTTKTKTQTVSAFALIAGLAMPAGAATTPTFVIDPANAASGIIVSRVTLLETTRGRGGYTECVFFTNTSPRIATRIVFAFEMSDDHGQVYQTDVFDRRGNVSPNVANNGFETKRQVFSRSRARNCQDTVLKRDPDRVRVRVMSVQFGDTSPRP
jgi:hypothetical protein